MEPDQGFIKWTVVEEDEEVEFMASVAVQEGKFLAVGKGGPFWQKMKLLKNGFDFTRAA